MDSAPKDRESSSSADKRTDKENDTDCPTEQAAALDTEAGLNSEHTPRGMDSALEDREGSSSADKRTNKENGSDSPTKQAAAPDTKAGINPEVTSRVSGYELEFTAPDGVSTELVELHFSELTSETVSCTCLERVLRISFPTEKALKKAAAKEVWDIDDDVRLKIRKPGDSTSSSNAGSASREVQTESAPSERLSEDIGRRGPVKRSSESPLDTVITGMPLVVTLHQTSAAHIIKHCLPELQSLLKEFNCYIHSVHEGGLLLLEVLTEVVSPGEAYRIRKCINDFSQEFVAAVVLIPHQKKARKKPGQLLAGIKPSELSCIEIGKCQKGDLCKLEGKKEHAQAFLKNMPAVSIIEAANISELGSLVSQEGTSVGTGDATFRKEKVRPVADKELAQWSLLEGNIFAKYPRLIVEFNKANCVIFAGTSDDVKEVHHALRHYLTGAKEVTCSQSKLLVRCIREAWCKVLLQKNWSITQVKAVMMVTDNDAAIVYGETKQDAQKALQVLSDTVKEAKPLRMSLKMLHKLGGQKMIYDIIEGKAVIDYDGETEELRVAGKADELDGILSRIREAATACATTKVVVSADAIALQLLSKHHQDVFKNEVSKGIPKFLMHIDIERKELILEGDEGIVQAGKKWLEAFEKKVQSDQRYLEMIPAARSSLLQLIPEVEKQTCTHIVHCGDQSEDVSMPTDSRSSVHEQQLSGRAAYESRQQEWQVAGSYGDRQRKQSFPEGSYPEPTRHGDIRHPVQPVQVDLIMGALSDQKADVLVNSVNAGLNLEAGAISSSLLQVAGREMQREIRRVYPCGMDDFQFAVTSGYYLKCKFVFHVVCGSYFGSESEKKLCGTITDCLRKADAMKMNSIMFPAIGTGILKYPPVVVAKAFYKAARIFSQKQTTGNLKRITFVIFDQPTFGIFKAEEGLFRQSSTGTYLSESQERTGAMSQEHSEEFTAQGLPRPITEGLPSQAVLMRLTIYGASQKQISDAFDIIQKSCSRGAAEQRNRDVTGNDDDGRLQGSEKLLKEQKGASDLSAGRSVGQQNVNRYLAATEKSSSLGPAYSTTFTEGRSHVASNPSYQAAEAGMLAAAKTEGTQDTGLSTSLSSSKPERSSAGEYPSKWGVNPPIATELQPGDAEYAKVQAFFQKSYSLTSVQIVKIRRIQDKVLWRQYYSQRDKMNQQSHSNSKDLEQSLWYPCTPDETTDSMLRIGMVFNRSSSSAIESYGKGVHFYKDVLAGEQSMAGSKDKRERCVILARVLTGQFTKGSSTMLAPPLLGTSGKTCDSTVNDVTNPTIFVLYRDTQAYPEYAITYKKTGQYP